MPSHEGAFNPRPKRFTPRLFPKLRDTTPISQAMEEFHKEPRAMATTKHNQTSFVPSSSLMFHDGQRTLAISNSRTVNSIDQPLSRSRASFYDPETLPFSYLEGGLLSRQLEMPMSFDYHPVYILYSLGR